MKKEKRRIAHFLSFFSLLCYLLFAICVGGGHIKEQIAGNKAKIVVSCFAIANVVGDSSLLFDLMPSYRIKKHDLKENAREKSGF